MDAVAAFTDSYLPTVNGVTYTVQTWSHRWQDRGGRMDVVFPESDYTPDGGEHPVRSVPFPFYDGYRIGAPRIPGAVRDVDLVHAHTPFSLGVAASRLARRQDLPLVASFHTPTSEYAEYIAPHPVVARGFARLSRRWERRFLDRADLVLCPTENTREHLVTDVGVSTPVEVLSNGVDIDRFRPVDTEEFVSSYDLDVDRPLVGYTGRHGFEKRLEDLVDAAADLDITLVFGGDGPARDDIERRAADRGVDARFLGFLPRAEVPAFHAAIDVFAFPSPVETEGLTALEAIACGTPVVGADDGALRDTIDDGEIGYRYETGNIADFRKGIRRVLAEQDHLRETCLDRRDQLSVDHTIDRLETIYESVSDTR